MNCRPKALWCAVVGVLVLGGCGDEQDAPQIVAHPLDQMVTEGETAFFYVQATGAQPLSYRWRKNGVNIPSAISNSYTTPPTTAATDDGANFTCVVTNAVGNVESNATSLTVVAPVLWINCRSQSVGGEMAVSVSVRSQGSYGVPLPDATVTINGTSIPYDGPNQHYSLSAIADINPGDDVTLQVVHGVHTISATIPMPQEPIIESPTPLGSPYDAGSPILVQWAILSPAPDWVRARAGEVIIFQNTGTQGSGKTWSSFVDGSSTETQIPADMFSSTERQLPGSDTSVVVEAANHLEQLDAEANLTIDIGSPVLGSFTTQD